MEEVLSKMPQGVEIIRNMPQEFLLFSVSAALVLIAGFYCLIMTSNLIRALIGLEILTKSVTLFIILAGHATGRTGLAQALAITLIVIEVVVIAVAVGIVLSSNATRANLRDGIGVGNAFPAAQTAAPSGPGAAAKVGAGGGSARRGFSRA